jgi:hypothetical protein
MLVEGGIAEDIAEISDLRAGDDPIVQAARQHLLRGPELDPIGHQEFELLRRIGPYPTGCPAARIEATAAVRS